MLPNILVTGTPGVGKSKICKHISDQHKYNYVEISALAKSENFSKGYDEEYECPILDEDKLLDYLEPIMAKGGNIVEYHSCDFFPERWFQAVYVVRCNNTILYDRLQARDYNSQKLKSNVECEIFMEILNEAMDSYAAEIVHELNGDNEEEFKKSISEISNFIKDNK